MILPRKGEVAPKATEGEDTRQALLLPPPPSGKCLPPPGGEDRKPSDMPGSQPQGFSRNHLVITYLTPDRTFIP